LKPETLEKGLSFLTRNNTLEAIPHEQNNCLHFRERGFDNKTTNTIVPLRPLRENATTTPTARAERNREPGDLDTR